MIVKVSFQLWDQDDSYSDKGKPAITVIRPRSDISDMPEPETTC
jgi:hypothetical protein